MLFLAARLVYALMWSGPVLAWLSTQPSLLEAIAVAQYWIGILILLVIFSLSAFIAGRLGPGNGLWLAIPALPAAFFGLELARIVMPPVPAQGQYQPGMYAQLGAHAVAFVGILVLTPLSSFLGARSRRASQAKAAPNETPDAG